MINKLSLMAGGLFALGMALCLNSCGSAGGGGMGNAMGMPMMGGPAAGYGANQRPNPKAYGANSYGNQGAGMNYAQFRNTSLAQKSSDPRRTFNRMDTNHDGYVSSYEVKSYNQKTKY